MTRNWQFKNIIPKLFNYSRIENAAGYNLILKKKPSRECNYLKTKSVQFNPHF